MPTLHVPVEMNKDVLTVAEEYSQKTPSPIIKIDWLIEETGFQDLLFLD